MAIIGISGRSQSGKDTVGKIIQYLVSCNKDKPFNGKWTFDNYINTSNWEIHKFADPLKDIICILTGCTKEQLEDNEFKNSKLPDEWIRYGYADGFIKKYIGNGEMGQPIMNNKQCDKERYEIELRTNWQTAYKHHLTYRQLLQYVGTDLFRNQLHEDTWINALMSKYKIIDERTMQDPDDSNIFYPNWIITDVRFPNEAKAIKDREGFIIRINRDDYIFDETGKRIIPSKTYNNVDVTTHPSEAALDDYPFDYIISNNGTIEELIIAVKQILINEKIL
jgi:hypothetical protein